jgi:FlaA1/EpsC-like NDP-sugar epimerase
VYTCLYAIVATLSWLLRYDFAPTESSIAAFPARLLSILAIKSLTFCIARDWMRRHRHTSLPDMLHVAGIAALNAFLLIAVGYVSDFALAPGRSVVIIDATISIMAVMGLRATLRLWSRHEFPLQRKSRAERTLVCATEKTAAHILRMLNTSKAPMHVVGIFDDCCPSPSYLVNGVPVLGEPHTMVSAARHFRASTVVVPASLPGKTLRQILSVCQEAKLSVRTIPLVDELVEGRYKLGPRDITISDLLRREPNQLDLESIQDYVTGNTVLVTGAAGSIGSELCRQLRNLSPTRLILLDQSESGIFGIEQEFHRNPVAGVELEFVIADICDEPTIHQVIGESRPQLIFHAAAYKHVPLMEQHPREAVRNNILGTRIVAEAALAHGVQRFVLISTDKAVRPSSLMGSTKLMAERCVHALSGRGKTEFLAVRFGNVLNSAGSVVPTFLAQIQAGGPITVTHPDMVRYFMTIPEAVQLVLQAGAIGQSGDVLILDMGEPVRIVDLARDMILLSGMRYPEDIDIAFTGMRPGEKLREELFYEIENGSQRIHDKIFRCVPPSTPYALLMSQVATLKKLLNAPAPELKSALVTAVNVWVNDYSQAEDQVAQRVSQAA